MRNELYHHGVIGQKWGEKNGPPYPLSEGQKSAAEKKGHKTAEQKESERNKRNDAKNRGTLTDEEIAQRIARLEAEIRLRDLTEKDIDAGKKVAKDILIRTGEKVVGTALVGAALYGTKALITKKFDLDEFGNAIFNGGPKKK